MNSVKIIGEITNDFTKDETIKIGKEVIYKSFIRIKRDSGIYDTIPVIVNYNTIIKSGDRVCINGKYVSYNERTETKSKLLLFIFADDIEKTNDTKDCNYIWLQGFVCKKQMKRKTPKGRVITDVNIAVNTKPNHSDYIPCIFWGINANKANELEIGQEISIQGRIQSRVYMKQICERWQEMVAYEVSVSEMKCDQ